MTGPHRPTAVGDETDPIAGPGAETPDPTGLDGPATPPRANGELVFTAPWQSRLFATTMALREQEVIDGERFRQRLIAEITAHTDALDDADHYDYWGCWQRALEALLHDGAIITTGRLDGRAAELAARPPDHDHHHPHDHD